MKPFNLEQALAGEPVRLRDGTKAYVKYVMPEEYKGDYPLRGIFIDRHSDVNITEVMWTKDSFISAINLFDIVGMWEEPRPRVQLDLPCPLEKPQVDMYLIDSNFEIHMSNFDAGTNYCFNALQQGRYFATKEDAEEWIKAMKGARR